MKRLLIILLLGAYYTSGFAQRIKDYNTEINYARWSLKFSPLHLIEPDQQVALSSEYRPTDNVGIQLGLGYIFNTAFLASHRNAYNTRGFRILPEIRLYNTTHTAHQLHKYIGIQLGYKHVTRDAIEWERHSNYEKQTSALLKKNVATAAIVFGMQRHPKRIGFDFNIAFGVKYKYMTTTPALVTNNRSFFPSYFGEAWTGYYPHLNATFSFCYRLKRNY